MKIALVQQKAGPDREANRKKGMEAVKEAAANGANIICYDRHYPEYTRSLALQGAEIVFVPQAGAVGEWPEGLYEAEMRIPAFQNGYFTALCNRVGKEEKLTFSGESFVCNPSGQVIAHAGRGTEEILYAETDLSLIKKSHARKLFFRDRRPDIYPGWFKTSKSAAC